MPSEPQPSEVEFNIGHPRSVRYRWVEVVPVPPIEKPPCDLWNVHILKPEWLDGGQTWLDQVDFSDLAVACAAAEQVDEKMDAMWRLRLATMDANRAVYTVASDVSGTRQASVTYRSNRSKLAGRKGAEGD
jgi:hypothetical protein